MALKDVLKAGPPAPRFGKLESYRGRMDAADREAFDEMIADVGSWPHSTLAKVMTAEGFPISDQGIADYRRRAGIA